jgi:hypothetical protein
MARYTKTSGGPWVKGSEVVSGMKCKLVAETTKMESRFKNDDGSTKMQDVSKVRFDSKDEAMNINLNRATIYGLIDAFGEESKDWCGPVLTAHTEKTTVAGKRVTALYLLPEGFEVGEDDAGYVIVKRIGEDAPKVEDDGFREPTI